MKLDLPLLKAGRQARERDRATNTLAAIEAVAFCLAERWLYLVADPTGKGSY
jgi:hypothetical protein